MVAKRLEEFEELVALVELELLVHSVGVLETMKIRVVSPSRVICVGVWVVIRWFSHYTYGVGLI